jgi:hypothetical protein
VDPEQRISAKQALSHPWIMGETQIPDVPLQSPCLLKMKEASTQKKFRAAMAMHERLDDGINLGEIASPLWRNRKKKSPTFDAAADAAIESLAALELGEGGGCSRGASTIEMALPGARRVSIDYPDCPPGFEGVVPEPLRHSQT